MTRARRRFGREGEIFVLQIEREQSCRCHCEVWLPARTWGDGRVNGNAGRGFTSGDSPIIIGIDGEPSLKTSDPASSGSLDMKRVLFGILAGCSLARALLPAVK